MAESLYRNSIYLMASTTVTAVLGFLFWLLIARLFTPENIGIAVTIIAATALISQLSLLGLKNAIIRYLPNSSTKNKKINTSNNIIAIVAVVLSVVYILLLPLLSSKLVFLRDNIVFSILFVIFVTSFSLNQLQEGVFIAYRKTKYEFIKNTLWAISKLTLPLLMIGLGAFGIFFAFSFGSVVSLLFGFYILTKKFNYSFSKNINTVVIKQIGKFSFGDYLGTFFAEAPYFLIPLFIINYIGAEKSAYYYIALQIATFLYIIPTAINQSLFAEGSHREKYLKEHTKKAFIFIFSLLVPGILITLLLGGFVLNVFGNVYAQNGLRLLQLFAVAGIFVAFNSIGSAILHIKKKIRLYIYINFFKALAIIILSIALLQYGLSGIGFAFLISQILSSLIYLFFLRKMFL